MPGRHCRRDISPETADIRCRCRCSFATPHAYLLTQLQNCYRVEGGANCTATENLGACLLQMMKRRPRAVVSLSRTASGATTCRCAARCQVTR